MAISQPQRAGTVKSPYRIPVHELGVNEDQSDAQAFLNGIKNGFGIVGEAGAFYLFFEDQALSLIHISEPTRPCGTSRMPSSA